MKIVKIILIVLIITFSFSCEKQVNYTQFERNVITQVFPEIVDSIYIDRRIMLPPPSPKLDFKTNEKDTTGYQIELQKYWQRHDSIKHDKSKILIAVNDYVEKIWKEDKEQMLKIYKDSGLKYDNSKDTKRFKLDLNNFKKDKKFTFEYSSKFPEEIYWEFNNEKLPVSAVSISRVQFDKTRTSGILSASSSCGGGKCGRGFLIIIKKKSEKWKVAKIIQTWVS